MMKNDTCDLIIKVSLMSFLCSQSMAVVSFQGLVHTFGENMSMEREPEVLCVG